MKGSFSKMKKWLNENLLLILTFSGVVIGMWCRGNSLALWGHYLSRCPRRPLPSQPRSRSIDHQSDRLPGRALHETPQVDDPPSRHRQPRDGLGQPQCQDERYDRLQDHPLLPPHLSHLRLCWTLPCPHHPPRRLQHQVNVGRRLVEC